MNINWSENKLFVLAKVMHRLLSTYNQITLTKKSQNIVTVRLVLLRSKIIQRMIIQKLWGTNIYHFFNVLTQTHQFKL